jgi:hypothetical protein
LFLSGFFGSAVAKAKQAKAKAAEKVSHVADLF